MDRGKDPEGKTEALRRSGALNRHPQRVREARFAEGEFFDARDLVQVKYEMLRRVRTEGASVTEAAGAFGMSRFSFYLAQAAFEATGLPGLTPKKPGPRGRHKLRPEVLTFVEEELAKDPSLERRDLSARVQERFGLSVHLRSLERALAETKKNRECRPGPGRGRRRTERPL